MKRILVVDDILEFRQQYELLARGDERNVVSASGTAEALAWIGKQSFDLVITDLQMEKERSGLEVLAAARAQRPPAQVIVVTRWGTKEISAEAMELGAFDYLKMNTQDVDFQAMLRRKIELALLYGAAVAA
ncbi:MAG: response regulator [Acidobacteria bacterium]|nr:response regulator [Acidobacteriota bacterium]